MSRNVHVATTDGCHAGRGHSLFSDGKWRSIACSLKLSARQLQILRRIFDDKTEGRIALELDISSHTVHTHVERVYHKLHVSSRCELLVRTFAEYLSLNSSD